jgi:hypothetical protein
MFTFVVSSSALSKQMKVKVSVSVSPRASLVLGLLFWCFIVKSQLYTLTKNLGKNPPIEWVLYCS